MKYALILLISLQASAADLQTRLQWLLEAPLLGLEKFVEANPPTLNTTKLGRLLFFDKRLSKDGTVSCASCHDSAIGFSSTTAFSKGVGGALGKRKAPVILNRAFQSTQFWDGSAATLEAQVAGPLTNPLEMANTKEQAVKTVAQISGYAPYFASAFGTSEVNLERIAKAIADFERTLMSGNSKFDRWTMDPIHSPLTELEELGATVFNDRECHICHKAPLFTDGLFHNTGVAFKNAVFADEGRYGFTKLSGTQKAEEMGAFKTPTLRNIEKHGPYMHDGSIPTLEAVIDFYDAGGRPNPQLDIEVIPLGLQPEDKKALLAFLNTLEGEGFEETAPHAEEFPR